MNKYTPEHLIRHLEQKLGLLYEEEPGPNNLCFANENADLRNEFKRIFTPEDLRYYSLASPSVPLPLSTDEFWERVATGKRLTL
ncbi:hypothetical protein [Leadbetterella sp. DM7]|uniref:hypothetical protein n=1 Tax=Leadbetterella sp. DM7 TaxID=3235085 RepID=UPI00349EE7CD